MNIRKITSMTLFISGIILLFNSIVLYVVPEGRVSYWADWRFLGLTKSDWGAQHTTVGFLFLFAGLLHIYYNWKPIVAYMKNKAKEFKLFTASFNVGLILTLVFVVGTYFNVPPMSTILNISEGFKRAASDKYGEPPYGHAESSSLKMFASKENLDLNKSMELLKASGIEVTNEKSTIKDIANKASKSPQEIYNIIKPASLKSNSATNKSREASPMAEFLENPQSGLGKKILADICTTYSLDLDVIMKGLGERGIKAEPENTLKQIGEANDTTPMQIYETMKEIIENH